MDLQDCETYNNARVVYVPLRPIVYICQLPGPNEMSQMPDATDRYVQSQRKLETVLMIVDMATFNQAAAAKPQYMNSGDSDASPNGTPSQFLLIRNLEPTVTEDLLAKGVAKLYKPGRRSSPPTATVPKKNNAKVASTTGDANLGAKEGSLRRILLVRDRRNNESWRYGFAEFATIEVIEQNLDNGCR